MGFRSEVREPLNKTKMTLEQYKELKAKAAVDGLYMGGMWMLSFACFIGQFRYAGLGFMSMLIAFSSAVYVLLKLKRYVRGFIKGISFFRAFGYSISVYFYAALLLAFAQGIYFQYIDGGYVMSMYREQLTNPQFVQLMQSVQGFKMEDLNNMLEVAESLRPIDIALNFLSFNVVTSFAIALPTAMIGSLIRPKVNQ